MGVIFLGGSTSWQGGNKKDVNLVFAAGRRELFLSKDMRMDPIELHAMSCKGRHIHCSTEASC